MKVIIPKSKLVSLIRKVQGIIPVKPSIPILVNVLLEASHGELILSASDLSLSIKTSVEAEILEEGSIALPAKKFFPLISELTAPIVEIHSSAKTANILSGSSKFKIQGSSKEEFPEIEDLPENSSLSISGSLLKELLSKTSFAAGKDETRPILHSVLLQSINSSLTTTGTDGKRLAKVHIALAPSENTPSGSFILPVKTVEEMVRLLESQEEKEEKITLLLLPEKLSLQVGSTTLISQLLTGHYPDVSRIIPSEARNPVSLHREELVSLLRQVALFTSENNNSVRFSFTPGTLTLSAVSGIIGEGDVNMPANYQGDPIDIAFNPNYFLDILKHSTDETILFDVLDSYNPGLITDSSNALFVLMPMKLDT